MLAAKTPSIQQDVLIILHNGMVKTMWIPTPIYERIPQFWLLLGLLFMSSGTYLGFDYKLSLLYFGVGFACSVWSLCIFTMRLKYRGQPSQSEASEISDEQQANAIERSAESAA